MNREGVVSVITNFGSLRHEHLAVLNNALGHVPCLLRALLSSSHPDIGAIATNWSVVHHLRRDVSNEELLRASQHVIILYDLSGPFILFDLITKAIQAQTRWTVYYVFQNT